MNEPMIRIGRQPFCNNKTLRYYEQLELIRPTSISPKSRRLHPGDAVFAIRKIQELQSIGFSLAEVKKVIRLYAKQDTKIEAKRKMLAFMKDHLAEVDEKMKAMSRLSLDLIRPVLDTRRNLNRLAKVQAS